MITFQLIGEMPSKKNAWSRGSGSNVYIPSRIQVNLDDFLWQLKIFKTRERFARFDGMVQVTCHFTCIRDADLDNITTTLLDLLQASGFIANDKNVQSIIATKKRNKTHPFVQVTIEDMEPELL